MSQPLNLHSLPDELLEEALLNLSVKDIESYSQTCQRAAKLCESQSFWNQKALRYFGEKLPSPAQQYKLAEQRYQARQKPKDSLSATYPIIYHWLWLYVKDPIPLFDKLQFWDSYFVKIVKDSLFEGLAYLENEWTEVICKRCNLDDAAYQPWVMVEEAIGLIEHGPDLGDYYVDSLPSLPEGYQDRVSRHFLSNAYQMNQKAHPEMYDDLWRFNETVYREFRYIVTPENIPRFEKLYQELIQKYPQLAQEDGLPKIRSLHNPNITL